MSPTLGGPTTIEKLRKRLESEFEPQDLQLFDDSAQHAGHAGARGGGHFRVYIVSRKFSGLTPIARHRLIYAAAGEQMRNEIHALSITARTPDEIAAANT